MRIRIPLALLACGAAAFAGTAHYVDWTAATAGVNGSASGTLSTPSGTVTVTYSGQLDFAIVGEGTNFWVRSQPPGGSGAYISATVSNAPPAQDMLAFMGDWYTNEPMIVAFSQPVVNPILAFVSLGNKVGQPTLLGFEHPFTILSEGPGFFDPPYQQEPEFYAQAGLPGEPPYQIYGAEGHGTILFPGTFSEIRMQRLSQPESWSGFTVGAAPVPEPSTWLLLATAALLGWTRAWRR